MLIIGLTYKKSLEEVNNFLEAHRGFLDKCYEAGAKQPLFCKFQNSPSTFL